MAANTNWSLQHLSVHTNYKTERQTETKIKSIKKDDLFVYSYSFSLLFSTSGVENIFYMLCWVKNMAFNIRHCVRINKKKPRTEFVEHLIESK